MFAKWKQAKVQKYLDISDRPERFKVLTDAGPVLEACKPSQGPITTPDKKITTPDKQTDFNASATQVTLTMSTIRKWFSEYNCENPAF